MDLVEGVSSLEGVEELHEFGRLNAAVVKPNLPDAVNHQLRFLTWRPRPR